MPKARDIMNRHFVGVSRSTAVSAALKLANTSKVNILPVIDEGKLCGIVFDSDLEVMRNSDSKVGSVMHKPVFADADMDVERVSKLLVEKGIGRIPVVESSIDLTCIGVISSSEVLRAMKKSAR